MSNKRITDLTELTTPTTDDVFPVVDIATNTTQKVQLANLPVQTAVTTALATKQATLVSGTNIKTINSTTLLGSGDVAVQPTLVSGVSIKTVNSTSLLGSGDIPIPIVTPSGVSGAIQFSNGSAFASDATNFFWDNTNKRLGIGTNVPSVPFEVLGNALVNASASNDATLSIGNSSRRWDVKSLQSGAYYQLVYQATGLIGQSIDYLGNVAFGNVATLGARVGIKGSGSTSATTSLLVQNSAGTASLQVTDDGGVFNYGKGAITTNTVFGKSALNNNSTGSQNASFGWESLFSNSTNNYNSAFGARALYTNTGVQNSGFGAYALYSNSTGSYNAAVGMSALELNTIGSNNSALGTNTVSGNFSGSVILGSGATATASNQFVVGSTGTNAGSVVTESNSSTKVWNVIINGVAQKILLV